MSFGKKFLFAALPFLLGGVLSAATISNFVTREGKPQLIPDPQRLQWDDGFFALPKTLTVAAPKGTEYEVSVFQKELSRRFPGIKFNFEPAAKDAALRLELVKDGVPESKEGYSLAVDGKGIVIRARASAGLFYGIQTLNNFIRNIAKPEIPCCRIEDWPDLGKRGVYLRIRSLKNKNVDRFLALIDAYASLKYNLLVLEFGENFPYPDNPLTLVKDPLTRENVRRIVDAAKRNHMEIMPYLQVLSHDEWLRISHPKWKELIAEDPKVISWKSASCPLSEEARRINRMAIREQIKLLGCREFFFCLDEFILVCPWQVCPKCKARKSDELLNEIVQDYSKFILECGAIPGISYDALYPGNPTETDLARSKADRRMTVHIWDYGALPKVERFKFFRKQGFPLYALSYCATPENTRTLPATVKQTGSLGCYLTYWHYMLSFHDPKQGCPVSYAGTTTAAEYQWKNSPYHVQTLSYDPALEAIRRFVPEKCTTVDPAPALTPLPIDGAFNRMIGGTPEFPQTDAALVAQLRKELAAAPERFLLREGSDGTFKAVVLSGDKEDKLPTRVKFPVNCRAAALSFLCFTTRNSTPDAMNHRNPRQQPKAAQLTFRYADGSTVKFPLLYHRHITDWNAEASGYFTRYAVRFNDLRGATASFFATDWVNPHPEKKIESITFETFRAQTMSPVLLAISMKNPSGQPAEVRPSEPSAAPRVSVKPITFTEFANFNSGSMGNAKFRTSGVFTTPPTLRFVDDPTSPGKGKVLEITVPPFKDMNKGRGRVYVDIPIPKKLQGDFKSLVFDYRSDRPEFVNCASFYLLSDGPKHLIWYNYGGQYCDSEWHRLEVPISALKREDGGITAAEGTKIRVSCFVEYQTEPFHIWIGEVGVSDEQALVTLPMRKAPVTR